MCKRLSFLVSLVLVVGLLDTAAGRVRLPCDCGICGIGWLQPGWISIPSCGFYEDVNGTGIDIDVAGGEGPGCDCRGYFGEQLPMEPPCDCEPCPGASCCCPAVGPLAGVEQDFLMVDDSGPSGRQGDIVLTFSGLDAGAPYILKSYHNRLDEPTIFTTGVQVTGATDVTAPDSIAQAHAMFVNDTPGIVTFTAGAGDVIVRYLHPTENCGSKGCQVFMNGFILEGGNTEAYFETGSSSALEAAGSVNVWVNLSDPMDETVYVYFSRSGGTATPGDDFTLPNSPLVFNAGQISKPLQIAIVNDGADEEDETIELTLTSVTGTNVVLGQTTVHIHTILDPRPAVGFQTAGSIGQETDLSVELTVTLSEPSAVPVIVDYAATAGTAVNGNDYYLDPNTLTFAPNETSKTFSIALVEDGTEEDPETIVLTLSNAVNAKFGLKQHTCSLFDPWMSVSFKKFKVDLACPGDAATAKEDWTVWEIPEGCTGLPLPGTNISNIAGTMIDAYISLTDEHEASGNLRKLWLGDPICNTFYSRFAGRSQEATVELTLSGSGLTAGEYWLYAYHNAETPNSVALITASGTGVVEKGPVIDAPIQAKISDDELVPSVIKFLTNGSGPVTITYSASPASNAVLNAFALRSAIRPTTASNPYPPDEADHLPPFDGDVDPGVVLNWVKGRSATSHDVYLGTDFNSVNDATTSSAEFKGNQTLDVNWYDPPALLEFGKTYYWRIDERNGPTRWQGDVWSFTTDDGKARDPIPMNGGRVLFDEALLSWVAGPYVTTHHVFFGTDFNDVNDADTGSGLYQGPTGDTEYDPGPLQVGTDYYWRIDEEGASYIKGDVWSFDAAPRINLGVDLALPLYGSTDYSTPWPESAKPGWIIWAQPRWNDMYGHDFVIFQDVGGSGVDVGITNVYEGRGGLKMAGLEMCSLNAAGCGEGPKVGGNPLYDPICNTWFQVTDFGEPPGSSILFPIYNLPPAEYALIGYHNRFKGARNSGQPHWECFCPDACGEYTCNHELPMASIEATSLAEARFLYGGNYEWQKLAGSYDLGNADGVELIQGAYDVEIQHATSDDELVPSLITFRTDGSPLLVVYTGTCCVEDDIRNTQNSGFNRQSGRAILNAFRLVLLEDAMLAFGPSPADREDNAHPESVLRWQPGLAAASHDVYFGTDQNAVRDANTTVTLGVYMGRQDACEYDPAPLELGQTYCWRIDEVNGPNIWPGQVWSFTVDLGKACCPSPTNGAADIARDVIVSWSPGVVAASHDVFFGTSYNAVNDADTSSAEYKGDLDVSITTYDPPGHLLLGQTYYWRIDEVNPGYTTSKGDVWSFTVSSCAIIDDMESYCEGGGCGNLIYDTWIDNFLNFTGALIGLGVAPEPVHGPSQSMRFDYDNDFIWATYDYSETERDFGDPCDWAGMGVQMLTVYFYGDPGNDATSSEQMYLGLEDSTGPGSYAQVVYPNMGDIQVAEWQQWDLELSDFSDGGVDLGAVKKIYVGFGDRDNPVAGGSGTVYFDDIEICAYRCILPGPYADLSGDCIVDHKDLRILAEQWLDTGTLTADLYPDGKVDAKDFAIIGNSWLEDDF